MSETKVQETQFNIEKCSAILVDVAGTATSLKFIKEELFTYVKDKAEDYLVTNWENENVKKAIKLLNPDEDVDTKKATDLLKKLTEEQSSNEGLKILQGLIANQGYENETLKGHVFSDVAECFENWAKNKKIAIYSTGSVDSQKSLFSHTKDGDLSKYINKYFDQSVGDKCEAKSYIHIAKELEVDVENVAFITDSIDEAKAAKESGVTAVLIKREGNDEIPQDQLENFMVINSFKDLTFESSAKRKCSEHPEAPPQKVSKAEDAKTENDTKPAEEMEVETETKETVKNETETTITTNKEKTDETAVDEKVEMDVEDGTKKNENPKEDADNVEMETDAKVEKENCKTDDEKKGQETTENGEFETKKENLDDKKDEKLDGEIDNKNENVEAINDKVVENNDETDKKEVDKVNESVDNKQEETVKGDTDVDNGDEKVVKNKDQVVEKDGLDNKTEKKDDTVEKSESHSGQKVPDKKPLNGEKNNDDEEHKETNGVLANGVEKEDKEETANGVENTDKKDEDENKKEVEDKEIKVKKITETTTAETTSENETLNG